MDKVQTEQLHFPFSGKPGLNVYLQDPNNPHDYSKLLITPEHAE
jgi:hypothetical protein